MSLSFAQFVWEGLSVFPVMGVQRKLAFRWLSPYRHLSPFLLSPFLCHDLPFLLAPLHVPLTGHLQNWKLHFNAVVLFSVSWLVSFPAPDFKIRWTEGVTCFLTKVNKAPNRNSWLFCFRLLEKESVPLVAQANPNPALQPPTLTRTRIFPQMKGTAWDTVKKAYKPGH